MRLKTRYLTLTSSQLHQFKIFYNYFKLMLANFLTTKIVTSNFVT